MLSVRTTRREVLRVGGLAFTGLAWGDLLRAQETRLARRGSFGRAKSCIVVFNYGGPSHIDTFDMKPDAPSEIAGEFRPIATSVPGTHICEHMPRLARMADRYTILRAVHHRDNDHAIGAYLALTGCQHPRHETLGIEFPMSPNDMPSIGSILSKVRPTDRPIFNYVTLGALRHLGHNDSMGQGAGCLGRTYDPFVVPFMGTSHELNTSSVTSAMTNIDADQLERRRLLFEQMGRSGRSIEQTVDMRDLDAHSRRAFELLGSTRTREAFQIANEPAHVRTAYGSTLFGQNCLLARRLVEAGVPMITLYSAANRDWDTHGANFSLLKNALLPPMDHGFSALLNDLDGRGLLDETLVVWMSDMGRTPRINGAAGRDHWSFCYSIVMAGGGIRPGEVLGSSDRGAAYPAEHQVTPPDIAATIFHCLGIDVNDHYRDQQGRPLVIGSGEPIRAVLS